MNITEISRFEDSRTIQPPQLIGRLCRLINGLLSALVAFQAFWALRSMVAAGQIAQFNLSSFLFTATGICVLPEVINIGFGKKWRPLYVRTGAVGLLVLAAMAALLFTGTLIGPPLTVAADAFLLYTFGHLGISFLLASVLATPGCEMRAIPQLWGMITGKAAKEHYCPGFLTPLDRWEYSKSHHRSSYTLIE